MQPNAGGLQSSHTAGTSEYWEEMQELRSGKEMEARLPTDYLEGWWNCTFILGWESFGRILEQRIEYMRNSEVHLKPLIKNMQNANQNIPSPAPPSYLFLQRAQELLRRANSSSEEE